VLVDPLRESVLWMQDSKKLYKSLQCKDALGMPFKGIDTVDTVFLRTVPPQEDKLAVSSLPFRLLSFLFPAFARQVSASKENLRILNIEQLLFSRLDLDSCLPVRSNKPIFLSYYPVSQVSLRTVKTFQTHP
jgi:hypothetical protein